MPAEDSRFYINVRTTELYGDQLLGKQRGINFDQGSSGWLRVPLQSGQTGGPLIIDVGSYSDDPTVAVRIMEATGIDRGVYEPDEDPELSDDGSSIEFAVPPEVSDSAGVYRAQFRVVDSGGTERARNEIMLLVDRGFWTTEGEIPDDKGPPTVAEVRTALRDHPAANRLLGDYEFDPAEIGYALVSAVLAYNTALPPVPQSFTTRTFPAPARRQWLDGTLSYLFETAATYFRRGSLPYSAGGLQVNDLAKSPEYQMMVKELRQNYLDWVKRTKTAISIAMAWGSSGSGQPYYPAY